ncbi:MAG: xanthine dehydrogenase family protein molybdopterin-binding subunit [Dehalococcoidia bacterium]
MNVLKIVGGLLPRLDAQAKVTGETIYAADVQLPGMLHAKVLRSPYAHARIARIDTSAASRLPGVHAVVTAADLPPADRNTSIRAHVVLADDEVLFHGQPVAAVAADALDIAEQALDLISVEYEALPAVLDAETAAQLDSPLVRLSADEVQQSDEGSHVTIEVTNAEGPDVRRSLNVSNRLHFKRGDSERGFEEADVVVEGQFRAAMVHQAYLEPQVCVADYAPTGQLTIWSPTQGQFFQRGEVAQVLGLPVGKVRSIPVEVGGGFGGKVPPLLQPLTALLSIKSGRPVKLVFTRREDFVAADPAPRAVVWAKLGAKQDGVLTTFRGTVTFDVGAFPSGLSVGAAMMFAASYRFEHLDVEVLEVITNKVSTGAYRAPGVPEVNFATEQLVDEVAHRLGMDPIEIRKQNAVREGDLMPNGKPWPRIGLIECLEALEQSDLWRTRDRRNDGKPRGIGVAVGGWLGGLQPASALVRLNDHGSVTVVVGSNDISGSNTSFAQIAAEVLGLPMAQVEATTADTDSAPYAGTAAGSKTTYTGGRAVLAAAEDARRQILEIAALELGAETKDLTIEDGLVRAPGADRAISYARIAALSTGFGARHAPVLGRGGGVTQNQAPGFTAQAVELEVDEETGALTVTGVAAAQDVGKAINRLSVIGQLEGGVVQSLGMGLTEELQYDARGRLLNASFLDYRLLTALDVPRIEPILVEVPSPDGPFGARIVGEPSITSASAALANAVHNLIGVRIYQAPLTPERVWQALASRTERLDTRSRARSEARFPSDDSGDSGRGEQPVAGRRAKTTKRR